MSGTQHIGRSHQLTVTPIPTTRSPAVTRSPYGAGRTLQLEILQACPDFPFSESDTVTALITKLFPLTMSSVREVVIQTKSGAEFRAILKLYDRRFGLYHRQVMGELPHQGENEGAFRSFVVVHCGEHEGAFQSFVQQGNMAPFLQELEQDKKTSLIAVPASHYYERTPEGHARYEAALWKECIEHFECETEAYSRLSYVQGTRIPRMYAHVRIAPANAFPDAPADLLSSPQTAPYFEVRGVLIELIDGYQLWDIANALGAPSDPEAWPPIIQTASDAAHEINKRGIFMEDCAPRNVVVDARTQKPFIIDLAQCRFKDRMVEDWREMEWDDDDDWDPDVEYWEQMRQSKNPADIGCVMGPRLRLEKGMELHGITFPDYDGIIEEIKRRKGLRAQSAGEQSLVE